MSIYGIAATTVRTDIATLNADLRASDLQGAKGAFTKLEADLGQPDSANGTHMSFKSVLGSLVKTGLNFLT